MKVALACTVLLLSSGCVSAAIGATGAVIGGAASATGAVVGGAVDVVTTSEEEQMRKDLKEMKRERD